MLPWAGRRENSRRISNADFHLLTGRVIRIHDEARNVTATHKRADELKEW